MKKRAVLINVDTPIELCKRGAFSFQIRFVTDVRSLKARNARFPVPPRSLAGRLINIRIA